MAYVDRGLIGCRYGASRPHQDIPLMVALYLEGKLMLDELVTETRPLEGFREIVEDMHAGKLARVPVAALTSSYGSPADTRRTSGSTARRALMAGYPRGAAAATEAISPTKAPNPQPMPETRYPPGLSMNEMSDNTKLMPVAINRACSWAHGKLERHGGEPGHHDEIAR